MSNELEKYKWNYKNEIRKDLSVGSLILAQPFLNDSVFGRAVCLMCAHDKKEGSFGFIVNKKTNFKVNDFIEELDHLDYPVYFGGPVATNTLYFLHDNSLAITDAQKISEGVYWGGDFEELKSKLAATENKDLKIKFILGYSGWDEGQLRKEIIEDSWIISNTSADVVYSSNENLWKIIMKNMGELYAHLANSPVNPDLN